MIDLSTFWFKLRQILLYLMFLKKFFALNFPMKIWIWV